MNTNVEQLKMLNLTSQDFDLLVQGLDELPNKGIAGDILGSMLTSMLMRDDDKREQELKKRELEMKKKEDAKAFLKEEIKILQGKLLMLKRYMQENNLLSQTYEILNLKD